MRTVCIIPAHLTSQRFPGKVLADLCGKPMLQHVLDRVALTQSIDEIVVALDAGETEEPLRKWCKAQGVTHYTGFYTTKDLLTLFYQVARTFDAGLIVRITSDCPLVDPLIINACIAVQQATGADYVHNLDNFPEGLDCEVFTFKKLKTAYDQATATYDREHVTPWIKRMTENSQRVGRPLSSYKNLHWSVDTPEDLAHISRIYERLPEYWGWANALKIEEELKNV